MQEALTLFDSICNSRWFVKTSIILFLNKIDLFREKLPLSPLDRYFPDFRVSISLRLLHNHGAKVLTFQSSDQGPDTYDAASEYILKRFVSLNQSSTKQVYTHFTCATDTQQIKFVMDAVNDIIVHNNLRDVGLL